MTKEVTRVLLSFVFLGVLLPCAGAAADDYSRAAALVRNHEWDAGLATLKPLLEAEPDNLQLLNLAGLALTGKGEVDAADRYFEKALALSPRFLPALKNLGINEFNTGKFNESRQHLSLALDEAPDDPVANLFAGQLAYRQGDFARAAATLERAQQFLSQNPSLSADLVISYLALHQSQRALDLLPTVRSGQLNGDLQFLLGAKLAEAGLPEAAVPYLVAANERPGASESAAFDLAVCYLDLKQYDDAANVLSSAVARGHETAELDNLLAEAYEGNHESQRAIDALRRAIALAPDDEKNYLDFASLCIDHQDYPAALKVLEVGLSIHPNSDRLYFERGILRASQDDFALAEGDFKKATALSPEKSSNYKGLGVLYLESGNAKQAVATLRQRLREKPNDADLLYLLGEALLRLGAQPGDAPYREAQTVFEKSVTLDPKACLPHVSLGKMYLEEGRAGDAVVQLEQARADDPTEKSTYWQLANAYRKLGKSDKQKSVLTALKDLNDEERSGARGRNVPPVPASGMGGPSPE